MVLISNDGRRHFNLLPATLKITRTALNQYSEDEEQTYLDTLGDDHLDGDHDMRAVTTDITRNAAKRYQSSVGSAIK